MAHLPRSVPPSARKRDERETNIRNVVELAREVRIHLRDASVIFGSVSTAANANDQTASFLIRPWGRTESKAIRFDDIALASPVKQMGWKRHREIAAAQHAGVFAAVRRAAK